MSLSEAPIQGVLEAYKKAVYDRDVDAFVDLYDADVLVFDMWGSWSYRGLEAWREIAAAWFGSLGDERVVVDFSDVHATVTADLAVAHAFARFTAVNVEGEKLRSLDNRTTISLVRRGDAWKIAHEHTSAPVAHDTAKAVLQR